MTGRTPVDPALALRAFPAVAAEVAAEGIVHGLGDAEHVFHGRSRSLGTASAA